MTITTTQKVIRVGAGLGIKLPAKELRKLGIKEGDEIQIVIDVPAKSSGVQKPN
jgi:antitoxin component of MazEF toxin-antitoxin module